MAGVAAFAWNLRSERRREQQTKGRGRFVPLAFRAGDACQFEGSEDIAVLSGERIKLQVAHIQLSHSRTFLVRTYLLQTYDLSHGALTDGTTMASMFDAHWHGFRVLGGVPEPGNYDSMRHCCATRA
jgi:hypothetical protein